MKLIVARAHRLALLILLAIAAAGCDKMGDVASGAGSATKNLANKISGGGSPEQRTNNQSASGKIGRSGSDSDGESLDEDVAEDEPGAAVAGSRAGDFNLIFEMSHQSCSSCGIWFDSAELVIDHSEGRFTARQSSSLLIKEAPHFQGRFSANISSIPTSSKIQSAILYMFLNTDEGISNDDFTSSISVYGDIGGSRRYIREITARDDIKGRGYSKANPNVPIDFTAYARQVE